MEGFLGWSARTHSSTAEQQEITNTTWEGHQTSFCGIPKHSIASRSVYGGGVASMSGREVWKFC